MKAGQTAARDHAAARRSRGACRRSAPGRPCCLDPTAFFRRARKRHGDTFVTDAFGFRLLCVFTPEGVAALYSLEEKQASFGLATYRLIKFKMPEELLFGRRVTPHQLFGRELTETYVSGARGRDDRRDRRRSARRARSRSSPRCAASPTARA